MVTLLVETDQIEQAKTILEQILEIYKKSGVEKDRGYIATIDNFAAIYIKLQDL
jgi:hypothetical protein